jgi:uncharacterized membrane protein YsdA (DUF1294 family)
LPILMLLYAAALAWGVWMHLIAPWVIGVLAALNLATFVAYRQDKQRAQQDRWRIAESQLHLWSFAGGWPGAWFAQRLLRHKSRKTSFRGVYWFTVVMHCAALAAWLWWASHGMGDAF